MGVLHRVVVAVPMKPWLLALPMILAGCGAPPAFLIASLTLDAAFLASTGKTPGEHALSAVVQQDCAVRQLMADGDLCQVVTDYGGSFDAGLEAASLDLPGTDAAAYG